MSYHKKEKEPFYPYVPESLRRVWVKWDGKLIKVIKMKDGSYTLGYNYCYTRPEGKEYCVTCEVKLDDRGNPYIDVYDGLTDFSKENCAMIINDYESEEQKVNMVGAIGVSDVFEGEIFGGNSVFEFVGCCVEKEKGRFFRETYQSTVLGEYAVATLLKYVQSLKEKQISLDEFIYSRKVKKIDLSEIEKELNEELEK